MRFESNRCGDNLLFFCNFTDKFKDEVVAESGGEGDSEDDEWDYIKGDTGTPADASFESVIIIYCYNKL